MPATMVTITVADVVGRAVRAIIVRPVVLAGQAVEGVIIQTDALTAGIRLAGQVTQCIIGVTPQAHVGVIQGQLEPFQVVGGFHSWFCRKYRSKRC